MRGEKIVRPSDDDGTKGPAGSAVPIDGPAASPARRAGTGGLEPSRSRKAKPSRYQSSERPQTLRGRFSMRWEPRLDETLHLSATDGIFWDRTERPAFEETDIPVWNGLPLAGGRLRFAALRCADAGDAVDEAAHHRSRRRIQRRLGPRGAGGRRYPAGAVDQPRARLRVCRSTGRASWASST